MFAVHWSFWPASKASKLESICVGRRSRGWDSNSLIPLWTRFKPVTQPSTICQSRLSLSANTWRKSIWCQFCLWQTKWNYLKTVQQKGTKTKANGAGSRSICFFCISDETATRMHQLGELVSFCICTELVPFKHIVWKWPGNKSLFTLILSNPALLGVIVEA